MTTPFTPTENDYIRVEKVTDRVDHPNGSYTLYFELSNDEFVRALSYETARIQSLFEQNSGHRSYSHIRDSYEHIQEIIQAHNDGELNSDLFWYIGADRFSVEISDNLTALFEFIDQENIEAANAKITELEPILGSDNPELTRARSLIWFLTNIEETN